MALSEDDIDEALHRRGPRGGRHRHPSLPPAHRGGGPEGAAAGPRERRAHGARHRLPPEPLGPRRPRRRARSRFVESAEVTAKLQSTLPLFDLIVGTEEEFHIAGGSTDTLAALRAVRAVSDATLVCKRGPMGAVAFPGAIPDSLDDGRDAVPASRSRSSTCSAPATASCPACSRAGSTDQDWPTALKYANACGAFAVSRHGCTPAYPVLGGAAVLPRARHPGAGAAQGRRARAAALGDQPPRRLAGDAGLRLRPPDAARDDRRRARRVAASGSAPSSGSASRRRSRSPPAGPATASSATAASAARRCTPPPAPGSGSAGRSRCPAPGRCGSRSSRTTAARCAEWPLEHVVKVLAFYHPDDDAGDAGRAGGDRRAPLRRRPRQPPRAPARDHPVEGRAGRTTAPAPRSSSASTTSASIPTGGSSSRCATDAAWAQRLRRDRRATTPIPAASWCWGWRRRPRSWPPASRSPRGTSW